MWRGGGGSTFILQTCVKTQGISNYVAMLYWLYFVVRENPTTIQRVIKIAFADELDLLHRKHLTRITK